MKALVTGGAGFIGSHLVEGLLASGWDVRVLDNFATGYRENIRSVINQIDLLEGDVTNLTTVRFAVRNVDVIFHEAALPSVARSVKNPLESNEVNITGTVGRLIISANNTTVFYAMVATFLAVLLASYLIRRSKFGLALQSIGESEEAAAHSGVNVNRVKVVIFAVSAFFMGATGATMSMRWTYIDPTSAFNIQFSFMPVLMAIFGGMGHLYAPITGAAIFSLLEEILTTKFPYYYMLLFGLTMLVVILFMPHGLEGMIERWRKKIKTGLGSGDEHS